ncbi:MAG: ribbon-helix-helix protein, CopG family [Deltaproteobacteria bacterium]|nr:ribbon-helix-helix protein, CopG family [Deltaproteobacteria bacterium]
MGTLTHKTTILLGPAEYRVLQQEARQRRTTMGELIRQAIRRIYLRAARSGHVKAWDRLFNLGAPVADWDAMEEEILKGRLDS